MSSGCNKGWQYLSIKALLAIALSMLAMTDVLASSSKNEAEAIVLEVNEWKLNYESFEMLYAVVAKGKGAMTRSQLIESIVEARLLADHAKTILGNEALYANTPVGYPVEVLLEDEFLGILRLAHQKPFEMFLKSEYQGELRNLVEINPSLQTDLPAAEQGLRLSRGLSPEAQAKYQQVWVGKVLLPSKQWKKISLFDLYEKQNIQGKMAVNAMDLEFIQSQAVISLSKIYFYEWLQAQGLVSQSNISNLRQIVEDKHLKGKVLLHYGLNKDIHDDNPVLSEAYKQVSAEQIKEYYQKNKEKFEKVLYVDARHIRLQDEATARKVQKELLRGMSFEQAIIQFSVAEDKVSPVPGSLGRIHDTDSKDWLRTVVFALSPHTISKPFRSPQANEQAVFWEIFYVDEKKMGYHEEQSETVRYIAGKEIALKALQDRFKKLRKDLFDKANIIVHKQLLSGTKK